GDWNRPGGFRGGAARVAASCSGVRPGRRTPDAGFASGVGTALSGSAGGCAAAAGTFWVGAAAWTAASFASSAFFSSAIGGSSARVGDCGTGGLGPPPGPQQPGARFKN